MANNESGDDPQFDLLLTSIDGCTVQLSSPTKHLTGAVLMN